MASGSATTKRVARDGRTGDWLGAGEAFGQNVIFIVGIAVERQIVGLKERLSHEIALAHGAAKVILVVAVRARLDARLGRVEALIAGRAGLNHGGRRKDRVEKRTSGTYEAHQATAEDPPLNNISTSGVSLCPRKR